MTKKEVENLVTLTLEKWADIVLQIGKAYREKKFRQISFRITA